MSESEPLTINPLALESLEETQLLDDHMMDHSAQGTLDALEMPEDEEDIANAMSAKTAQKSSEPVDPCIPIFPLNRIKRVCHAVLVKLPVTSPPDHEGR